MDMDMNDYYKNRKIELYFSMFFSILFVICIIFQIFLLFNYFLNIDLLVQKNIIYVLNFIVTILCLVYIIHHSKKIHYIINGNIDDAAKWDYKKILFLAILFLNIPYSIF